MIKHSPALLSFKKQTKGLKTMTFNKRKAGLNQYNTLLKAENDRLTKKMSQLEKELDQALSDKENVIRLLNTYKNEYESLIEDSKKLIEKQKNAEKVMDRIIEDYMIELEKQVQ